MPDERRAPAGVSSLTLLGEEADVALVLRSGRAQPGLLVQGDSLSIAAHAAEAALIALGSGDEAEVRAAVEDVAEQLRTWRAAYERLMNAAARPLPYTR